MTSFRTCPFLIALTLLVACFARGASAAAMLIGDDKSRAGSSLAEKFIDVSAEGVGNSFLGVLADAITVLKDGLKRPAGIEPAGDTLWYCELDAGRAGSIPMPR